MREKIFDSALFDNFLNDHFILFTSILSGTLGLLYVFKGLAEGFFSGAWIISIVNFLYIPFAVFFKRKCFSWFYLFYSVMLVFFIAFEKTFLFNNYTALFVVCLVILFNPKIKFLAIFLYFIAISIAFSINGETFFHFLIHLSRSVWFFGTVFFVVKNDFERKQLILY